MPKPHNVIFLFPTKGEDECSDELHLTANSIVDDIDSLITAHIDRSIGYGEVGILYQNTYKHLQITITEDGQNMRFDGETVDGAYALTGVCPTDSDLSFIEKWLDYNNDEDRE